MIGIVDYGLGNINAFAAIYRRLGIEYLVASKPSELSKVSHLILPGVGAFDWAMHRIRSSGFLPVLDQLVLHDSLPVLGICVGMQVMANSSEEGSEQGLGWISGTVRKFDVSDCLPHRHRLPHMGWNNITPINHPIFADIQDPRFYFLHSYYFQPSSSDSILSTTKYPLDFASSVCNQNVLGIQFHPEKSHHSGVQLLKNFASL